MKKSYLILGAILGLAVIIFFMYRSSYNTAITLQENVDEKWGNVGANYQRRADLVP
ncbi:MAG: LemA family protein, partial [Bacteroidia bacterium]|nr:LemA family protein [Bacteroidia bacterium]